MKKKYVLAAAILFAAAMALWGVTAWWPAPRAGENPAPVAPGAPAPVRGGAVKPPEVSSGEVKAAIDKGVAYLKSRQARDGSWPYREHGQDYSQGAAALAVYAMSEAGVPETDPAIQGGIAHVLSLPFDKTYCTSCSILALSSVNAGKYVKAIGQARDFLVAAQSRTGMWTYEAAAGGSGGGDNSNTQFAVMGLHAAASLGLAVPAETFQAAMTHYYNTQNGDGGWGYTPKDQSYGSMTAGGVGALHLLGARLAVEGPVCGQYRQDPRVAAGFAWLARNFSVKTNPGKDPAFHFYYYLYSLERVGVYTGEKYIGNRDWYLEGARVILDSQNRDGSWPDRKNAGRDALPNTCFALLFLAKGNAPVLINKLAYNGDWNADVHDAENLTRYISSKINQRVEWQTVTLADPPEALSAAPILYITGHKWPDFTKEETAKLSDFLENGGFILAEGCCQKADFEAGLKRFVSATFPDRQIAPLDRAHPVYRAMFNLPNTRRLDGLEAGCRTTIIYSPQELSCAWEKNDMKRDEEAFQTGANIAAFITGGEKLEGKLDQYKVAAPVEKKFARGEGAFAFAQIIYGGRWNPHPAAGPKLLAFLNAQTGLDVSGSTVEMPLTDPNLAKFPFIYMASCSKFALNDDEKKALKSYLERGGFLFADAAGGKPEFDQNFRRVMAEVFPEGKLEPMPADSPIYTMAFDVRHVRYTKAVRDAEPGLDTLTLYELKIKGRTAVVYSPYDIGCALERFPAYGARGLVSDDAFKAASNIVLYALSY